MGIFAVKVENSGRILIPADLRKKFGLTPGEDVLLSVDEEGVRIVGSRAAVIQRIQKRLRRYVPAGRVLSEELIADRIREARAEETE